MNVSDQVRQVIGEALSVDPALLSDDTAINDIPDFDSLAMFDVVFMLEKKFDVKVLPDVDFSETDWKPEDFNTIGDIVRALEKTLRRVH